MKINNRLDFLRKVTQIIVAFYVYPVLREIDRINGRLKNER